MKKNIPDKIRMLPVLFSKSKWLKLILPAVLAAIMVMLLQNSFIRNWDGQISDAKYQHRRISGGQIVLVNIDERALKELGPQHTWKRTIIADVIKKLNKSDQIKPAAIGVDILFTGDSDPESDQALVDAASAYGNVVVAAVLNYGQKLERLEDGTKQFYSNAVIEYSKPYEALEQAAMVGFINATIDTDGIMRHHRLEADVDGKKVDSFDKIIAEYYAKNIEGRELTLPNTSENGLWYIPFSGPAGTYNEEISVVSILNEEIPAEYFADRIVLIGPYAVGLQDQYVTSADRASDSAASHSSFFFGIEIHANIIEALLRGTYQYELDDKIQMLIVWAVLFAACMIFGKKKTLISAGIWMIFSAAWFYFCIWIAEKGVLLHILWLPISLTLLFFGYVSYTAFIHFREKRQITNMFSHYVAPEIVKELIKLGADGLQLGGREATIAVLFVDIRGFTTMSEALEPTEVVQILNEYLTLITDCILQNHGTLDKFVGDCAMAVWGSPLPQEDYVMHAVQAGIDMAKGARVLAVNLMEKYGRTVDFGIGVNVGPAVIGNMGSPIHMDYTAIGDTVNTAARLEANAPAGHVYISRSVADALGERIQSVSLGDTIKLKGKKEGFEVLDLVIPD